MSLPDQEEEGESYSTKMEEESRRKLEGQVPTRDFSVGIVTRDRVVRETYHHKYESLNGW